MERTKNLNLINILFGSTIENTYFSCAMYTLQAHNRVVPFLKSCHIQWICRPESALVAAK